MPLPALPDSIRSILAQIGWVIDDRSVGSPDPGIQSVDAHVYGVTGDGVTDDGPALQYIHDNILLEGQAIALRPKKTYRLATGVTLSKRGTRIRGRTRFPYPLTTAANGSQLKADAAITMVTLAGLGTGVERVNFWGNGKATKAIDCLDAGSPAGNDADYHTTIASECMFNGINGDVITFENHCYSSDISNNTFVGNEGVALNLKSRCHAMHIFENGFYDNAGDIDIGQTDVSNEVVISNNNFSGCRLLGGSGGTQTYTITFRQGTVVIRDNYIEATNQNNNPCTEAFIQLGTASLKAGWALIEGNRFNNADFLSYGIKVLNIDYLSVLNNRYEFYATNSDWFIYLAAIVAATGIRIEGNIPNNAGNGPREVDSKPASLISWKDYLAKDRVVRKYYGAATTNLVSEIAVDGDTNDREQVFADGTHKWGPGNGAVDVTLARTAAKKLQLTGTFITTGMQGIVTTLADAPTVAPDAAVGMYFRVTLTASRTIGATANIGTGSIVTFEITNGSGGAITTTWNAQYKLAGAWVDPAAGKARTISFVYNGSNCIETARSAADI